MKWTRRDIDNLKSKGITVTESTTTPIKKKHKYGAVRTCVNGIWFDSAKEAGWYRKLLMMEQAGYLKDLRLQVPYDLNPGGTFSYIYRADFVYTVCETGETVVADAKGFATKEYRRKRKLMLKVWGITVKEI